MPSVAPDNHKLILNQVYKYRRRIFVLILFRGFVWSGTILIAGMGLSRFKLPGLLILTILVACSFAAYYLWHNYPRIEHVVRILDQRLSLKEGLVTAFQFSGSERHVVPLLIRQLSPRLTGASPCQIFPFKMPGVLLAWPFLLALLIVPAEKGPLRFFNFHQSQGDVESLKADADDPVQEDIVNREGGAIPSDRSPSARMYPMQQRVSDKGDQTGETETTIPGLTKDDETHMPLRGTKEHENVIPAQAGIQGRDRVEIGFSGGTHPHLNPLPEGEKIGTGGLSAEMLMPLQGTKEHKDAIPAQAGIQNDGRGLDSHFRGNDGDGKEWVPTDVGMTDAVHPAVVQILARQDIPQDYKEYVKSYFDVIQKEGQDHGEE